MKRSLISLAIGLASLGAFNASANINIDKQINQVEDKVIEWRRCPARSPTTTRRHFGRRGRRVDIRRHFVTLAWCRMSFQ